MINIACCQIADGVMQPDPAFIPVFFFVFFFPFFGCVFLNLPNMSFSVCIKGCTKQGRGRGEKKKPSERHLQNGFVNMTFENIPRGKGVKTPRDI